MPRGGELESWSTNCALAPGKTPLVQRPSQHIKAFDSPGRNFLPKTQEADALERMTNATQTMESRRCERSSPFGHPMTLSDRS